MASSESTSGEYGSGSQIRDGNTSQGNDYVADEQRDQAISNPDPLTESLGSESAQRPVATSGGKRAPDTTDEGGYGVNQAGDSFSDANQTGAVEEAPNTARQFQ